MHLGNNNITAKKKEEERSGSVGPELRLSGSADLTVQIPEEKSEWNQRPRAKRVHNKVINHLKRFGGEKLFFLFFLAECLKMCARSSSRCIQM